MPRVRSLLNSLDRFSNRERREHQLSRLVCAALMVMAAGLASGSAGAASLGSADGAEPLDCRALAERPEVLRYFSYMVDQAEGNAEVAAFILSDGAGAVYFLPWPRTGEYRSASWQGSVPDNVIGIAHTHPNDREGMRACAHDRLEARRTGLPIFIVMEGRLSVAEPESGRHLILARGDQWREDAQHLISSTR
ncbi:MAG: hypothetical protein R3338_15430 [Thermoanaerobaculia bacterium]|nr:hypothetical protein [Thermoanaerobaculia bacterium]